MPKRSSKRGATPPSDENEAAARAIRLLTDPEDETPPKKNPAAVALGRLGGKKGGPARAAKLSKARRSEIAKAAAAKRWGKTKGQP
jgi:hypothetical protein